MKTIRRNELLKLAKAGKLVCVESYKFDDQLGEDRGSKETPVRVKANHDDWKDGFCNLSDYHFSGKSGRAYTNNNGTITLYVHSNLNYTFKVSA